MPVRPADKLPAEHATLAFHAWRSSPNVMVRAHTHTDLEFNLPLGGNLEYFFAGRFLRVPDKHFAVFWAGVPHRLIARSHPDTQYLCLTLPLAWFLGWRVGGDLSARLMGGEMVMRPVSAVEETQFNGWAGDFSARNPARERIALLEVEAFLRRAALEFAPGNIVPETSRIAATQAERIAAYAGTSFQNPELTVATLARAVGLHEKYALAVFKAGCGMTLWEYVTRLRVSHAQRLLLTTDESVDRVGRESGFASPGRFFAAFKKYADVTPRCYRETQTG